MKIALHFLQCGATQLFGFATFINFYQSLPPETQMFDLVYCNLLIYLLYYKL